MNDDGKQIQQAQTKSSKATTKKWIRLTSLGLTEVSIAGITALHIGFYSLCSMS